MAKFGTTMTPSSGLAASHCRDRLQPFLGEPGGAGDDVDVLVEAEPDVVHHDVRVAEVDDDLTVRVGQREQPFPAADGGHQIHVVGLDDGLAGLGAHPAARTDHADPQQLVTHPGTPFRTSLTSHFN